MNDDGKKKYLKKLDDFNDSVKQLLAYTPLQYMLNAVQENPRLAEIYVDDEKNPSICIMLLGHYLFIGGKISSVAIDELYNTILTEDTRNKLGILIVFYENMEMVDQLNRIFLKIHQNERSLYYIKPQYEEMKSLPKGITRISNSVMQSNIENLGMITEEIIGTATYNNMDDFYERGIGYTPIIENRVCGFCTSEYPSTGAIAIGIEVVEEYQNQGIAKTMTKAFLSQASLLGLDTTYWECWKRNEGSVKTALSCGFNKIADYPVLFIELNDSNIKNNLKVEILNQEN